MTLVLIQPVPFLSVLICTIQKGPDVEVGPNDVKDALLTLACIIPSHKTLSVSMDLEGYCTKKGIRNTTLKL